MLFYLNEGAISSIHFVHALSAGAGLHPRQLIASGMAPDVAEGQHCPLPAQHQNVGLAFRVFIQSLCSCWLW